MHAPRRAPQGPGAKDVNPLAAKLALTVQGRGTISAGEGLNLRIAMSILSKAVTLGFAAAAATAALSVASVASAKEGEGRASCFFTNSWRGWSSPSPDVLYLDVGHHRVYRVDVLGGGSRLKSPGSFLVSKVRGSNSICSHLDLDLAVSDTNGFHSPLIATKLTLLTPEQVAAIPRKDRP